MPRTRAGGEIHPDPHLHLHLHAYQLMRGVGNPCIGADSNPRYDARRLVELLVAGLRADHADSVARRPGNRSCRSEPDAAGQ
ncbi:hypothetical protein GCM10010339_46190 [Streptomyces alanosinicus]|uniref:Uncharacterized protein n=1 Tax=Streptomyces alanosinicus TaxID=68171 RepID=A0A919D3R2_9ACTN|nr:hypothetical protein GCM10010339_46190 [Streptomyces alanosinicus]